jgi:hypothetical protein
MASSWKASETIYTRKTDGVMKMSLQNQKGLVAEAVTGKSDLVSVLVAHIKNSYFKYLGSKLGGFKQQS